MRFYICFTLSLFYITGKSQLGTPSTDTLPRWSIEIQAGMQGNFFVSSKDYGPNYNRPNFYEFYQKNFLGTVAGADVIYQIDRRSRLGFGYMVSKNKKQVNFVGVNNGFYIVDWNITHTNHIFQAFYERNWSKKIPWFRYHAGIFYLRPQQQEIEIWDLNNPDRLFLNDERNYQNSNLEEGGFFAGVQILKKIDTHFELGLRSRVYFTASTGEFEMLTLTPTLTYSFSAKTNKAAAKTTAAETKPLRNLAFFELGGNGPFASLNYERQITKKPGFAMRLGVGYYNEYENSLTIPLSAHYLIRLKKPNSFLDASIGGTWARARASFNNNDPALADDHSFYLVPGFGYRKHTRNNWMWRTSITPIIYLDNGTFTPWVGLSLGKLF